MRLARGRLHCLCSYGVIYLKYCGLRIRLHYARICEDSRFLSTCTDVIVATYQEDSTFTLWRVLSRFPLQQSPLVCWKMCFVVHRVLRDGPKKVGCVTHLFTSLPHSWSHCIHVDKYSQYTLGNLITMDYANCISFIDGTTHI